MTNIEIIASSSLALAALLSTFAWVFENKKRETSDRRVRIVEGLLAMEQKELDRTALRRIDAVNQLERVEKLLKDEKEMTSRYARRWRTADMLRGEAELCVFHIEEILDEVKTSAARKVCRIILCVKAYHAKQKARREFGAKIVARLQQARDITRGDK